MARLSRSDPAGACGAAVHLRQGHACCALGMQVHMPHAKSREKLTWEAGPHRTRMDLLYKRLVQQLVAKYEKPRTMSCTAGHLL